MAQINCADCVKTYRPYRLVAALLRVLMYGFSDWWEFEDERVIEEQFRVHWRDRNTRRWLIDKMRTYILDYSFAGDFNSYYQYLENKHRKNISATFLCFDCEKYYCTNCVSKHSEHFTFSKDDKYHKGKWRRISAEMLNKLKAEGDRKRENMKREQTVLHDVLDVKCEHDELDLGYVLIKLEQYKGDDHLSIDQLVMGFWNNRRVEDLHISNDDKRWLVTDGLNNCIKIFNVNNNKITRLIKLSSWPHSITEIPSTDPSRSLIAVCFPDEKQIIIRNIHSTPARVVSSISIQNRCEDLCYCNNKLITMCWEYLGLEERHIIHVLDISGEIINIIDLRRLPGIKLKWIYNGCMSVHSESETIYLCHTYMGEPSCVISLSLDGQVLHYVTFNDLEPALIHVDKDQNVYVMSHRLPIYKLSADLKNREKIIDQDIVDTDMITSMRFHHDDKFYLASRKGPETSRIRAMEFHNGKFYLASDKGLVYIIQHE